MLELSKQILQKVSFDRELFKKELRKSIAWINPNERSDLKEWCLTTFGMVYQDLILDVFDRKMSASY
jgi:argininosuccinate lyase